MQIFVFTYVSSSRRGKDTEEKGGIESKIIIAAAAEAGETCQVTPLLDRSSAGLFSIPSGFICSHILAHTQARMHARTNAQINTQLVVHPTHPKPHAPAFFHQCCTSSACKYVDRAFPIVFRKSLLENDYVVSAATSNSPEGL